MQRGQLKQKGEVEFEIEIQDGFITNQKKYKKVVKIGTYEYLFCFKIGNENI